MIRQHHTFSITHTYMHVFLFILCILSFFVGGMMFVAAKSAIHEIEASLLFLISAVSLVDAATVEVIERLLKAEREAMNAMREIAKALQWMVDHWKDEVADRRPQSNPLRCRHVVRSRIAS
jgi:hypothetical protein